MGSAAGNISKTVSNPSKQNANGNGNKEQAAFLEEKGAELKHFVRSHKNTYYDKAKLPAKVSTKADSNELCPDLPHMWLCSGTLLRLLNANHPKNDTLFRDLWTRGQPVIGKQEIIVVRASHHAWFLVLVLTITLLILQFQTLGSN
jgi:hypothetical protein